MSENRLKIGVLKERRQFSPKFQIEGVIPPNQPFFFSENLIRGTFFHAV